MTTRSLWMFLAATCFHLAHPAAVVAQLRFTATPTKANQNPNTKQFDIGVSGTFEGVACPLQVKFVIRQTDSATGAISVEYPAPLIVPIREQRFGPGNPGLMLPNAGSAFTLFAEWIQWRLDYQRIVADLSAWVVAAAGRGPQEGVRRNANRPWIGDYSGFGAIPTYDTTKFRYEMRVEFWSNDNYMGPYKDPAGNEWVAIPK